MIFSLAWCAITHHRHPWSAEAHSAADLPIATQLEDFDWEHAVLVRWVLRLDVKMSR